ncbi:DNA-binding transcriptional regulator, LysR family [Methylobacterium sp. UNC378MF]|uniref:LysR family transcriptional regulator n=1 Tax=Methylobacterium sp. UNC378MF TaxID=1502748 RepID=UPI0008879275|nr:LysR family transcriptional regulator [Methylobacterium sp. UNC378MF]SDA31655.1 DNA-binding transcriptional regulator, LysR family [Methylobacterium sp. UNC378MF]
MRFDLRHVTSCLVLAQELHFGRAAQRLATTQPGLSRLIAELEIGVGVKLFRRTTRTVEVTEAGRAFLAECRIGLDHLERAVTLAQRTATGMAGVLRVGYMDFAINGRLPELVRAFSEVRPGIRLELSHVPSQLQREALLNDRIDVGFTLSAVDNEHFDSLLFDRDSYVALLPVTHPLSNARSLTLKDLAGEPFVMGSGGSWSAYREAFFAICHRRGFHPIISQEASSSEGIFGLVAAGAGVSTYASCVRNVQRRGIVIRSLDDVPDTIATYATWMKPARSTSLEAFTSFLATVWGAAPASTNTQSKL